MAARMVTKVVHLFTMADFLQVNVRSTVPLSLREATLWDKSLIQTDSCSGCGIGIGNRGLHGILQLSWRVEMPVAMATFEDLPARR
jgi:hypothetical protein